jgi:hypothetical protein
MPAGLENFFLSGGRAEMIGAWSERPALRALVQMRKSRILHRSFCDANVRGSQVKAVLLNVIKTLSHVDARFGCSSGQINGPQHEMRDVVRIRLPRFSLDHSAQYTSRNSSMRIWCRAAATAARLPRSHVINCRWLMPTGKASGRSCRVSSRLRRFRVCVDHRSGDHSPTEYRRRRTPNRPVSNGPVRSIER